MRIDRLKSDLDKAKQKITEWQARARDIERQITEQENLAIIQTVRGIAVSPEELAVVLKEIQSMKGLKENSIIKEGEGEYET